jgi:hypothetical protein
MKSIHFSRFLLFFALFFAAATVHAGFDLPGVPREPHPSDRNNALVTMLISASLALIGTAAITWIFFWGIRKFRDRNRS